MKPCLSRRSYSGPGRYLMATSCKPTRASSRAKHDGVCYKQLVN